MNNEIFKINERFKLRSLNDEMFWLFDIENGEYFELNTVSYFILNCFDGARSTSEIYEKVIEEFKERNGNVIKKDFNELFEKLRKEDILELVKHNTVKKEVIK